MDPSHGPKWSLTNMTFNHIMVDLETTGTSPEHSAIVQLSAVRFNFETREIDMNMFDQCLLIPKNRFWEEDTRDWWATQDQKIIHSIWSRMRDPKTVMTEFAQWAQRDLDGETVKLWAKPSHFEYPFIESYFKAYDLPRLFHYRHVEDLNSWCRARGCPDLDGQLEFEGDAHNAIHDVLHQIKTLFTLLETTNVA